MHWSWKLGKQGLDYREEREKAADIGTVAHDAVERWVRGEPRLSMHPEAERAFEAFRSWAAKSALRIVRTEVQLVSEKFRYGGTLDAVLEIDGKRAIGDWKSSNRVYADYMIQCAAYGQLWNENFPDQPINGGYHLLRFDKTFGDFHHHHWAELDAAWIAFRCLRKLYDLDGELKKRAA
jgi:hypothetical protein